MSSLSKERLKEIVEYQPGGENYATRIEWMAMARELLAYREAQGKAVMWWTGPEPTWTGEIESTHAHETGSHQIPLYAAPQLPAVPDKRIMAIEGVIPPFDTGNSPVIPDGWTDNDSANSALVMLDRINTIDLADDARIEEIKRIIRHLAAAPKPPATENQ